MKKIGQDWSSVNTMQSRVEVGMKVTLSPVNIGAEMVAAKGCGKLPWSGWLRCLVQCRCTRAVIPSFPPSNRCFKVPLPPTTPSFKLSWKRRFQRNFSRAGRCYFLPLCPSRRSTRWKNWRIFWNFETHFGESLNFDFPREKSFLLCNFEFSRIFSCEKYLLWAMITDSRSWELRWRVF